MADAATKAAPAPFLIENVVRREGTRLHRARSTTRHRFKQFIGGQRVLRNQKLPLTPDQFKLHEKQIVQMLLDGAIAVHTPDGLRVTTTPGGQYILTKRDGATKVLPQGEVPSCFSGGSAPAPKAAPPPPEPVVEEEPPPEPVVEEPKTAKKKSSSKKKK